jgi:hypothetical protein
MEIKSRQFENNEYMSNELSYYGDGKRPDLVLSDVPDEAVELALIVSDPDAPSGNFIHWTAAGIDPKTTVIPSDSLPPGITEGLNDRGAVGYIPPRPPSGTHRYIFELIALNQNSGFAPNMTARDLLGLVKGKEITRAKLVGLYKKAD